MTPKREPQMSPPRTNLDPLQKTTRARTQNGKRKTTPMRVGGREQKEKWITCAKNLI